MKTPILFFDAYCPFCRRSIATLSKILAKEPIFFAPLQGKTASSMLKRESVNSVIYFDPATQKKAYRMKAIFLALSKRFLFLKLFVPIAFLFSPIYILIAKFRFSFSPVQDTRLKGPQFLE